HSRDRQQHDIGIQTVKVVQRFILCGRFCDYVNAGLEIETSCLVAASVEEIAEIADSGLGTSDVAGFNRGCKCASTNNRAIKGYGIEIAHQDINTNSSEFRSNVATCRT